MKELSDKSYCDVIVSSILLKVKQMEKEYKNDPDIYDTLWHIEEVGTRLLNNDYFAKSMEIQDNLVKHTSSKHDFSIEYLKWNRAYKRDCAAKQKDYDLFFKLISQNIEEWV